MERGTAGRWKGGEERVGSRDWLAVAAAGPRSCRTDAESEYLEVILLYLFIYLLTDGTKYSSYFHGIPFHLTDLLPFHCSIFPYVSLLMFYESTLYLTAIITDLALERFLIMSIHVQVQIIFARDICAKKTKRKKRRHFHLIKCVSTLVSR